MKLLYIIYGEFVISSFVPTDNSELVILELLVPTSKLRDKKNSKYLDKGKFEEILKFY